MKKIKLGLLVATGILFGCQKAEMPSYESQENQPLQTVTISAGMGSTDTKVSVNTETGCATWQEGDVISVLATDDKFYNFTISKGAGKNVAEFTGKIPNSSKVTTVAIYPGFTTNGVQNNILKGNILNYTLPAAWTYSHRTSNVPLAATFEEGAEYFSFRQIGGIIRFPVYNLPANAIIAINMADKTITGEFPLDITELGESAITAGSTPSEVTIKYTANSTALYSELNIPVPVGVYNNFTLSIKVPSETDSSVYTEVFTKKYTSDKNIVKRANLLIMKDIVLVNNANPEDSGIGTEPDDNVNYDGYGLGEFPISYFYGPPTSFYTKYDANGQPYYDYELTKSTYQDVKDAGFNIAIYGGEVDHSLEEQERVIKVCQELGLKFMSGFGFYSIDHIETIKNTLYKYDNYIGDYVSDEPSATQFDKLGEYTDAYHKAMPDKDVYINLFPYHAKPASLGTATYEEHVDQFLEKVKNKVVSYDYYGLLKNNELRYHYYMNADVIRKKTLDAKRPYWMITQAGPIATTTIDPNEKEQRFAVWSNIAMGSKGIAYFTYYSPGGGSDVDGCEFIIRRDGTKRDMYYWIQKINKDINTIGKKLIHCHADGAIQTKVSYPLFANNGAGRTKYGPIQKVAKNSASQTAILVGCFRDARSSENGPFYKGYKALVMAKLPNKNVVADLTLDSSITKITFTQNNVTSTIDLTTGLDTVVGDIKIAFVKGILTLSIPSGEAVLLEF